MPILSDRARGAMSLRPRQLALALDHAASYARDDFLAGPGNEAALRLIESWPDWPANAVALIGPEGSGKTHLATIWAAGGGSARHFRPRARRGRAAACARDRGARCRGCRHGPRRARAVSPPQPRPRGERVAAAHRARRAGDLAGRDPRSCFAAAGGARWRRCTRPTTPCCGR